MSAGLRFASPLILVLAAGTAMAQQRSWSDPPAQIPPPPPPVVEPAPAAPPASAPAPRADAPPPAAAPPAAAPPVRQAEPVTSPPVAAPPVRQAEPAPKPRDPAPAPRVREVEQAQPAPRAREVEPAPPARPREAAPVEAAPPVRQAQPRRTPQAPTQVAGRQAQERAAENLALDYLDAWSEPNSAALDLTRDFYGSRVLFHGREMSAGALFEEKRRFAQRWPERTYRAYPETVQTDCDGARDLCTVRAGFDFMAQNPGSGRRSAGRGTLQLIVSFAGDRPLIVSENSWIGRSGRNENVSLEDLQD
jgi:hypothetical protein